MIVIADVFPKLQTLKFLLTPLSQKGCFRTRFDSKHVKASEVFLKSKWEHFRHLFSLISIKLIRKMCPPIVLREILVVLLNTLSVDGKYPGQYCENLQLPIQMQLSEKQKTFSDFFVPFLESTSNFKFFQEKYDCHN